MFYIPLAENTYIYFYMDLFSSSWMFSPIAFFISLLLKKSFFTHSRLALNLSAGIFFKHFFSCSFSLPACFLLPIEFSPLLVFLEVFWKNWLFLSFFFISHSVLHFLIQISRWIVLKPDNTLTEFVVLSHEKKKLIYRNKVLWRNKILAPKYPSRG